MDKPIAVGDLVQVVKYAHPCKCGNRGRLGQVFRVSDISVTESKCGYCEAMLPPSLCAWIDGKNEVRNIYVLKRIPPLSELEGVKSEETLKETA